MEHQRTLKSKITVCGKGLHCGKEVCVTLLPAEVNTGIRFCRADLKERPIIEARIDYVSDTSRGTTLEKKGVKVATIEHLMASLNYFGIDNILIELSGEEIPILDGSAKIWVKEIQSVGTIEQVGLVYHYEIREPIHYEDKEKGVEITALPYDGYKVDITIDYNSSVLPKQTYSIDSLKDFPTQIAPCRTFVFLHEIEALLKANLIKGGDLDNALIFVENNLTEEQLEHLHRTFPDEKDIKVEKGILNNVKEYFDNEPVRHKLLDFIGDIRLLGIKVKGHFILKRPGHKANTEFVKQIRDIIMQQIKGAPVYDSNKEPIYSITDIKKFLPHRFPMLLVDKVIEVGEDYVVGLKNITNDENFFNGHFPQEPVMPGVLIVEHMAQTGGILVLKNYPDPENYNTYFLSIDGVKFRGKVVPGDTLISRLVLTEPVRRGIVKMRGEAFVGSKLVVEAELMAQVAKTQK